MITPELQKKIDQAISSEEEFRIAINGGMFEERIDCKEFLENYFNIQL